MSHYVEAPARVTVGATSTLIWSGRSPVDLEISCTEKAGAYVNFLGAAAVATETGHIHIGANGGTKIRVPEQISALFAVREASVNAEIMVAVVGA